MKRPIPYLLFMTVFSIHFIKASKAKTSFCLFEEKVILSDDIIVEKVVDLKKPISAKKIAFVEPVKTIIGTLEPGGLKIKFGKNPSQKKFHEDNTELIVDESYIFFLKEEDSFFTIFCKFQGYYLIREGGLVCFRKRYFTTEEFINEIYVALEDKLNQEWLKPEGFGNQP